MITLQHGEVVGAAVAMTHELAAGESSQADRYRVAAEQVTALIAEGADELPAPLGQDEIAAAVWQTERPRRPSDRYLAGVRRAEGGPNTRPTGHLGFSVIHGGSNNLHHLDALRSRQLPSVASEGTDAAANL
jgi:hypothetical protein